MIVDSEWRRVQERTGKDILSIVMDLAEGRETAERTIDFISEHCEACYDEGAREMERLRNWVHDLQSRMYINCVYCGHRYGPSDEVPASMADVLKQHIEVCPEHPMSKCKKENEMLRKEVLLLRSIVARG